MSETRMNLAPELQRRQSLTDQVLALFRSRPREWIGVHELSQIGGFAAWRTRVSEARQILEAEGGRLENRVQYPRSVERDEDGQPRRLMLGGPVISEYRFVPYVPLGPSAESRRDQLQLW